LKTTPTIIEPACVIVSAGAFRMGCETGRDEEQPVHEVWIEAFELAVLQVTVRDYGVFLEDTHGQPPLHWGDAGFSHPAQPVVAVSWFEAAAYCEWLTRLTGRRYRLPSEAEWERAAKGDADNLYPWGNELPQDRAEYRRRWGGTVNAPLPVGGGSPTAWGFYDLGENVHEWCADWFRKDYYAQSPALNPRGPETGERRASRGGSWRHQIKVSRCAARSSIPPSFQYADYGFRVSRETPSDVYPNH
jgi:formylglycine-generating enzyme